MANIRHIDFTFLDELLDTGSGRGYVLNFSDKTFAQFFADELDIDIDDEAYLKEGTSKGKRLRYFLKLADAETAARTLNALWEYRAAVLNRFERADTVKNAQGRLLDLIDRLRGNEKPDTGLTRPAFDKAKLVALKDELNQLALLPSQDRGYGFEKFLKLLFDTFGLKAREPFRLVGEQIDGSFDLGNETYLLEAKWHADMTPAADLHVLQGKLEQKAAWARGLFVSYSGFTEEGLLAFGRGKRVVCMDGRDIWEALERQLPLNHVLEQKVRRAAETGSTFVRVSDLFR